MSASPPIRIAVSQTAHSRTLRQQVHVPTVSHRNGDFPAPCTTHLAPPPHSISLTCRFFPKETTSPCNETAPQQQSHGASMQHSPLPTAPRKLHAACVGYTTECLSLPSPFLPSHPLPSLSSHALTSCSIRVSSSDGSHSQRSRRRTVSFAQP